MSDDNQAVPNVVQPAAVAALLDSLPGLVGAIDKAILDTTGRRMPIALLVFAEGAGMHASNFGAAETVKAVKELVMQWEKDRGESADTAQSDKPH